MDICTDSLMIFEINNTKSNRDSYTTVSRLTKLYVLLICRFTLLVSWFIVLGLQKWVLKDHKLIHKINKKKNLENGLKWFQMMLMLYEHASTLMHGKHVIKLMQIKLLFYAFFLDQVIYTRDREWESTKHKHKHHLD